MSTDRTDRLTADLTAGALHALAELVQSYGGSFRPALAGDELFIVVMAQDTPTIAPAIVAGMVVKEYEDRPFGSTGRLRQRVWAGALLGGALRLTLTEVYRPDDEPPAAGGEDCRACGKPGRHPDTCPTVPVDTDPAADVDELCEDSWHYSPTPPTGPCPACGDPAPADTDPARAAAELPAGPVSHWPIVVPRPRRPWLYRGVMEPAADVDATQPSWAAAGFDTAFSPRPHARGLVPITDPALLPGYVPSEVA